MRAIKIRARPSPHLDPEITATPEAMERILFEVPKGLAIGPEGIEPDLHWNFPAILVPAVEVASKPHWSRGWCFIECGPQRLMLVTPLREQQVVDALADELVSGIAE